MKLVIAAAALLMLTACSPRNPSPDEVRERTAKATETVKQDTKAVAEGIREGLKSDKSDAKHTVDINSASKSTLTSLPGIDDESADRIIANRPYHSVDELLTKRLVIRGEYDRIASRITAR